MYSLRFLFILCGCLFFVGCSSIRVMPDNKMLCGVNYGKSYNIDESDVVEDYFRLDSAIFYMTVCDITLE